ncbi:MAG TPA: MarR family transcriptional regulator [Trueperaceae bacterium]
MPDESSSSPSPPRSEKKAQFIEEMGQLLASFGIPHMAGRILAALLVATPAEQSAEQLAETLQASRGSISTMTRLLEAPGIIERVRKPGDRRTYYRNTPDGWHRAMEREAASMSTLRALAEKGLALMEGESAAARRGIEESVEFFRFWEREMDAVLDRWLASREEEKRK